MLVLFSPSMAKNTLLGLSLAGYIQFFGVVFSPGGAKIRRTTTIQYHAAAGK